MKIRKEILGFTEEMEKILRKHDADKLDSWKSLSHKELQNLLHLEVEESDEENAKLVEWIDIANICMMIWWNTTHKK